MGKLREIKKYFKENKEKPVKQVYEELRIKIEEGKASDIEKVIYEFLKSEVIK